MSELPLSGRRILVTRAPHQASALVNRLQALGATPIQIPTIEIAPPSSYGALDEAVRTLGMFDVVAFTSANAVDAFHRRALHLHLKPRPARIAAVGPATDSALRAVGLHADVLPSVFTAEALAQTLRGEARGRNFLLVLGEDAASTLQDGLVDAGANVTIATAYSTRVPAGSISELAALFAQTVSYPDAVTFTSASTVNNLVALLEAAQLTLPESVIRASIGPVTSRASTLHRLPPHLEAAASTVTALAECLAEHFNSAGPKLY